MTDAGKKALEELVAGLDLTTHDKIADALEACDWVGVSIGIKCLARVSVEQFRKMSADRIRAIAAYVATLEARATAAEERVKGIKEHAHFLIERLDEINLDDDAIDLIRDWNGHIGPALSRLRAALTGDKP